MWNDDVGGLEVHEDVCELVLLYGELQPGSSLLFEVVKLGKRRCLESDGKIKTTEYIHELKWVI